VVKTPVSITCRASESSERPRHSRPLGEHLWATTGAEAVNPGLAAAAAGAGGHGTHLETVLSMPELPDIEVFRRYLRRRTLHDRVDGLSVKRAGRLLKGISTRTLDRRLRGRRLDSTHRHGKYLFVGLDDGEEREALVIHFGMSGCLAHYHDPGDAPDHARVVLDLGDGSHLAYDSQRLLGQVALADPDAWVEEHELGPDALRVGRRAFVKRLSVRRGTLKPALMDQTLLAGIGNVYSDEILFQGRLHPKTPVSRLDEDELGALHRRMRSVLKGAIRYRADPERVPRTWLLPHREPGARCPRCRGRVRRPRVGGRSAWICPVCQKKRG
jgi:formamidopyrimidine-DNA glycosylase